MTTIFYGEKFIGSRQVIARIDELESGKEDFLDAFVEDLKDQDIDPVEFSEADMLLEWDDGEEYNALKAFAGEAQGYCQDWNYGVTLINADYFTEYVIDMLADIGDIPRDIPNYLVIDEEATAENIKMDYTPIELDGETFYVR